MSNDKILLKIDKDLEKAEEFSINLLYMIMLMQDDDDEEEYPIVTGFHKVVL